MVKHLAQDRICHYLVMWDFVPSVCPSYGQLTWAEGNRFKEVRYLTKYLLNVWYGGTEFMESLTLTFLHLVDTASVSY